MVPYLLRCLWTDWERRRPTGEFLTDTDVRAVNSTIASQTEIECMINDKPKSQVYFTRICQFGVQLLFSIANYFIRAF